MNYPANVNSFRPPIIVVSGPTASGKSALALALAQQLGGEIVNADSVQIYKRFDIGSAKPSPAEMAKVPHHLFSVLEPDERCNLGLFIRRADEEIAQIHARGGLPVVTGGTGLYVQGLLHGVLDDGMEADVVSARLSSSRSPTGRGLSDDAVYSLLKELDPLAAAALHPRDGARVRRALEVVQTTGRSLAELQREHGFADLRYPALVFVTLPDRGELYRRIDERVELMLNSGLIEEVQGICRDFFVDHSSSKDSCRQCPGLSAIGYRHMLLYLGGHLPLSEAVTLMKRDTRHFAKRQYTWWRNQPGKRGWQVEPDDLIFELSDIVAEARNFITGGFITGGSINGGLVDGSFISSRSAPGLVSVRYLRYSPNVA